MTSNNMTRIVDPLEFAARLWPDVVFYRQQQEIIYSVVDNDETFVPAGNMLGKDFVAAFIALWFFITRNPCRVVTTSVDATQLEGVLWGEIRRFIQTSKFALSVGEGGPLLVNHLHLRQVNGGKIDGVSYMIGRVAAKGEGMLGHHIAETGDGIPRTLFLADEASGVDDVSFQRADTWARRKLIIGNPYPCENFFRKGVEGGDIQSRDRSRYYRKVIKITGHDSPNVRLSKHRIERGLPPIVTVPGVLPYDDYIKRLETWDPLQISVGIDAQFYQGSEVQLYPLAWLEHSHRLQTTVNSSHPERTAKAMGVDPAEGGDTTCWCVIDEYGILDIVSMKTPNTQVIVQTTLKMMLTYRLHSTNVLFDAGGGGRQIVDQLTSMGHLPRTVNFGDAVVEEPKRGMKTLTEKSTERTSKQAFKNMRAQMYGELRERMNPEGLAGGFAIPRGGIFDELRRQMVPIPMMTDAEGKLVIPPKHKPSPSSTVVTLTQLIGRSPDEADSLVLALHALLHKRTKAKAGAGKK